MEAKNQSEECQQHAACTVHDGLTQAAVGVKPVLAAETATELLVMLDMLLTRENVGVPTGILPLAFSDMPRNCVGTASSIEESDGDLDS